MHRYASKFAPAANEITLQHEELTVEGIKQLYIDCSNDEDKYKTLVSLYGLLTVGSSIIFVKVSGSTNLLRVFFFFLSDKLSLDSYICCGDRETHGTGRP